MNNTESFGQSDPEVVIIGSGNVATHLFRALHDVTPAALINSRTLEGIPPHCPIALLAVKDDAIEEVAQRVKGKANILAHTSGSVAATALKGCAERYGVFYPMQTFSKGVELDYSEIPFFIEGSDPSAEKALSDLARKISGNVRTADSTARKKLHLAAVFACNFTNRLIGIADELLRENDMDYTVMLPLLRQTIGKLSEIPPTEAQTGPAVRRDRKIIDAHLAMLDNNKPLQDLYRNLTEQIIDASSK